MTVKARELTTVPPDRLPSCLSAITGLIVPDVFLHSRF